MDTAGDPFEYPSIASSGCTGHFLKDQVVCLAGELQEKHFSFSELQFLCAELPLLHYFLGATTAPLRHEPPAAEPAPHTAAAMEPALQSVDCAELPELHWAEATLPLAHIPPRAVVPDVHCSAGDPPVAHPGFGGFAAKASPLPKSITMGGSYGNFILIALFCPLDNSLRIHPPLIFKNPHPKMSKRIPTEAISGAGKSCRGSIQQEIKSLRLNAVSVRMTSAAQVPDDTS
ncbi:MAG: hypothetical protein M1418_03640 [Deltaproteobacteria bacterium]|nr:hypothetical protein [Deltaproteobacteria bacterium]